MNWHPVIHRLLDWILVDPGPDPLARLSRGRRIVESAARRGGGVGAVGGLLLGLAVFLLLPAPKPRHDEMVPTVVYGMTDQVVPALLCTLVGTAIGAALGYAVGQAVGERYRREVEG